MWCNMNRPLTNTRVFLKFIFFFWEGGGEEGGRLNFFDGETIFQLEPWTLHNSAMIAFHLKGTGV